MELKERIKQLRTERNWTQKEIAEKLGYPTHNAYNQWEKGKSAPSVRDLDKIADAFGVTVMELLFGEGAPVHMTALPNELEVLQKENQHLKDKIAYLELLAEAKGVVFPKNKGVTDSPKLFDIEGASRLLKSESLPLAWLPIHDN